MNNATFKPENNLEASLIKAATDPAHRPQFYKDLIASDIFVIEEGTLKGEGKITLQKSQELTIRSIDWKGRPVIPVFSSLARLQAAAQREATYVALNALEFMKNYGRLGLGDESGLRLRQRILKIGNRIHY